MTTVSVSPHGNPRADRDSRYPVTAAAWFVAAMIAVLWPSRFIGPLDGVPLDRLLEAALLGLGLPWLFWIGRDGVSTRTFRAAVIALLIWKGGSALVASQQGLCATFRSP